MAESKKYPKRYRVMKLKIDWIGTFESHVEKRRAGSFPVLQTHHLEVRFVTVFSVVVPLLLDMVSPSQAQDLYIGWALHQGGQLYSSYYAGQGLLLLFTTLHYPRRLFFLLGRMASLLGGGYFLFSSTDNLTGQRDQAKQLLTIFYILVSWYRFWRRLCYDFSSSILICRLFFSSALSIKS